MAKLIAFYLPQFHPIPENDRWWGPGFTEWTNVARARPLFRGHYQPHIPADLGFYDLRVPETRAAQAELARRYGIHGFCYYHYWFAGKRLLERPFNDVLRSGEPDFPFCLCWANQTWTGVWHGAPDRILIEQTYPGLNDYERHFEALLPAFADPRYIKVEGRPVFVVFRPAALPKSPNFVEAWQRLARAAGLPGLFLVGVNHYDNWQPGRSGFDASIYQALPTPHGRVPLKHPVTWFRTRIRRGRLTILDYREVIPSLTRRVAKHEPLEFPCVIPNWDNTPRTGYNGLVFHNSTPDLFRAHLRNALSLVADLPEDRRIVFVKSWNEWAEGNHLEPCRKYGHEFLQVIREELAGLDANPR